MYPYVYGAVNECGSIAATRGANGMLKGGERCYVFGPSMSLSFDVCECIVFLYQPYPYDNQSRERYELYEGGTSSSTSFLFKAYFCWVI